MLFTVTFKTPDVLEKALTEAIALEVEIASIHLGMTPKAFNEEVHDRVEKALEKFKNWFQYNEAVTLELSTHGGAPHVVQRISL